MISILGRLWRPHWHLKKRSPAALSRGSLSLTFPLAAATFSKKYDVVVLVAEGGHEGVRRVLCNVELGPTVIHVVAVVRCGHCRRRRRRRGRAIGRGYQ